MIPELNISAWAHRMEPQGVAFTVKHESEVLISPEVLLQCIRAVTDSSILEALLNEIAKNYSSDNGYFSVGFAAGNLTEESKEFYTLLAGAIEDADK